VFARGAPGRILLVALACVALGTSLFACTGNLRRPDANRSTPAAWHVLARLPGFIVHTAVFDGPALWVAGERANADPPGALLRVSTRSGRVEETLAVPAAVRLRAMVRDPGGVILVGGQDDRGRALLVERREPGWARMVAPPDATIVDALAVTTTGLMATFETPDDAPIAVLTGGKWRVRAHERAVAGGTSRLPALAAAGARVVAAGTDGGHAVVLESDDGGRTFSRRRLANVAAVNNASSDTSLLAGVTPGVEGARRGVLLRWNAAVWRALPLPETANIVAATVVAGPKLLAGAATGAGDVLLSSTDEGRHWAAGDLPSQDGPAVLEGILATEGSAFAFGGSAIYAGPA
jgi:hypothetical protein